MSADVSPASEDHRERELKFDAPDGWQLPGFADVLPDGGSVEQETIHLESTYFDTAGRDLLRSRMTLRRRSGDADTGWHLKVPDGNARLEIRQPLDEANDVPAALRDITLGIRAGADLAPVATLVTERSVHRVLAADGRPLVEVVLDDVTSTRTDGGPDQRWREVEAELVDGDEALLDRIAQWLDASGAHPAASESKLARALASAPPARRIRPGLTTLLVDYLDAQHAQLMRGDIELRRGHDAVHATRVASRRYRSVLRVLAPVLDEERAAALDVELAWYATALGELRDRHVLRDHLDAAVAALPAELVLGPVSVRIHQLLDADLAQAQAALDEVMSSGRYFALIRELRAWHDEPPVHTNRPSADAAVFLDAAKRTLRRRLKKARRAGEPDAAMHRARKAAKRLRYVAELCEPELGVPASKARARAKKLQEELGARQDSVVAAEFLRRAGQVAGTAPGENGFTFGLLYEREQRGRHTAS